MNTHKQLPMQNAEYVSVGICSVEVSGYHLRTIIMRCVAENVKVLLNHSKLYNL